MTLHEFSSKYFNFTNNWHHLLFYDILSDEVFQMEDKKLYPPFKNFVINGKSTYVKKRENKRVLILSPRFSAKSTIISFIYPLFLICTNPNIRILVVSANEDIATSFVRQVLHQLENNEKLLHDFHYLIPKKYSKWGEKAFIVKRDTIEKDPTMSAAGILGKIVSKRADVIILDDIIDLETSRTQNQRKKVIEWFDNVLYPILEPQKGRIIIVGTSWFKGDLYDTIYSERDMDIKIKLKAILRYDVKTTTKQPNRRLYYCRFTKRDQPLSLNIADILSENLINKYWDLGLKKSLMDGSLWPDKWNFERLEKQKKQIGETAFCRQYLNEPISGIDSFFSKNSIDIAYQKGKNLYLPSSYPQNFPSVPQDMIVVMGVDLAMSTTKTSDYSAIAIWGLSSDKTRYLLYLEKFKKPIEEVKQKIIDLYHLYHPIKVIVESNIFQDLIRADLGEEIDVEGIKTTAISKFDEARGLGHMQTLFDQHKIVIPNLRTRNQNILDFYNELLQVRLDEKSHTPDTVMASWFALQFLKNYDELITQTAGFFTVEGVAYQSRKLVHPSQYAIAQGPKLIPSYNSIFYSFIPRDEIFKRKYFLFASYIKTRVYVAFFDIETGEFLAKIDATITPSFAADWFVKRAAHFNFPLFGVYKDYEGTTLLYELQNKNYPNLMIAYPREDGLPIFENGVPPLSYLIGPAFEFVKYHAQILKNLHIKDKATLLDFSRVVAVSGKEIITSSKNTEIPQKALTFALGYYLLLNYNRLEEKLGEEGKKKKGKIKYDRPHYTIFNY